MEFGKAFGAVPALKQESLARRDIGEVGLERARFAGKNERRKAGEGLFDRFSLSASG
jgi:hypothetical protein